MSDDRHLVFVSYSHADAEWLDRLKRHLAPLERDLDIEFWDNTRLNPGTDWRAEIGRNVSLTKVAILLVSADFLASRFIAEDELPPLLLAAQADGALILPLILSPC